MLKRVAALCALCFSAGLLEAQDQNKTGQEIVGSWRIEARIPGGVPVCPGTSPCFYQAMASATSDGTLILTATIPGTTIGHGAWKSTGARTFRMAALYFRVDNTGAQVGTSEAIIDARVDETGRNAVGSFTAALYDLNNREVLRYAGSVVAKRIEAE